jgi:hypothetical protein
MRATPCNQPWNESPHRGVSMLFRRLSGGFTGGLVGAFIDSFNIWILGVIGITGLLGVGMRPEFTPSWLYPRLVWGGLFGLLFALPVLEDRPILRGILFSLLPSALMLFVVLPNMGKGLLGLGFGSLTPLLVVSLNFIWGIVAAYWYRISVR